MVTPVNPLDSMRKVVTAAVEGTRIPHDEYEAIRRNAESIKSVPKKRITEQLTIILNSKSPSVGFRLLESSGLLQYMLPELVALKGVETREGKGHKDNFLHTMRVLDNVAEKSDNVWLRWAALLHDIAKPVTKRYDPALGWTFHNHNFIGEKMVKGIFRNLRMPMDDKMKYVAKIVGLHMRPQSVGDEDVSDSGVRRLITEAGENLEDLMILAEADITSKNPEKVRRQLEGFAKLRNRMDEIKAADEERNWKSPVNGNELKEYYQLPDGRWLGYVKEALRKAIREEKRIPDEHDAAWEYAKEIAPAILEREGLTPQTGV